MCENFFATRLGDNPEKNLLSLIDNLIIALNEPFGLNMNMSYEVLMASPLWRLQDLIELYNKKAQERR